MIKQKVNTNCQHNYAILFKIQFENSQTMFKIKAYTAYYLLKYIYGYDVSIGCSMDNGKRNSFTINNDYNKVGI